MYIINALALIVVGIAAMGFGLMLFYTLLPLFYALFGVGVGYWLGSLITSTPPGEMSVVKALFAGSGAILFAAGAHFFESFRRILIGIGLGSLLGALIASALGLTGFFGIVIMAIAAVLGAFVTLAVFDTFIVVASALGGAGLVMDGIHLLLSSWTMFDRSSIAEGAMVPLVIWVVAAAIAMGWQFMNIEEWTSRTGKE